MAATPPRPPPRPKLLDPPQPLEPTPPAEMDAATKQRLSNAISKAIATELGSVRVSSVPPPESGIRASMRVAADVGGKYMVKGVTISGAVTLIASLIALWRPEYKMPIAQAFKLIGAALSAIGAALAGGAPSGE